MEQGQHKKYQEISKKYKDIVDAVTTLELSQLKLYFVNLEKKISSKAEPMYSQDESVKHLLDNTKEGKGKVPLHFACARGNTQIVKYLIQNIGLDATIKDKEGNNPYLTAIQHGNLELVKYFIEERNFSPNETKDGEISCLHLAANHNHVDLINYLISKGANIEKVSVYGKPINWAVGSRNEEATKILLDHGADPNGDHTGTNLAPIILAIDYGLRPIYDLLMQKGANIQSKDPNGYTLLHLAAQKGDLQIVKDLINRGSEISVEVEGKSPLYLAFEHAKWDVVSYLKSKEPNFQKVEEKIRALQAQKQSKIVDKPRAQQIKTIGNKMYAEKKYQQALQEYKKAVELDPENEVIHRNIAACQLALHKYQQALFHCQIAKKKDPRNVKTIYRQAQALIGLNNLIDASASLWECSLIQPNNQFFREEFLKLVEKAKAVHAQHKQNAPL